MGGRSVTAGGRVGSFVQGEQPLLCTRGMIASYIQILFVVRHPRHPIGCYVVLPFLSLAVTTPEIKFTHRSCHPYASPPHRLFFVGCGSPFTRLAQHLTALRAWCKQCLPDPLKPDLFRPGIVEIRGSGHTTTAMHDIEYTPSIPPPPPPPQHHSRICAVEALSFHVRGTDVLAPLPCAIVLLP